MSALEELKLAVPDVAARMESCDRALLAHDTTALAELLSDDLLQITPAAIVKDKAGWFAWFQDIEYDGTNRNVLKWRDYGNSVVIVSDCLPVMRIRKGEPAVHTATMLEVWNRVDGTWKKAVEQYTRAPQK